MKKEIKENKTIVRLENSLIIKNGYLYAKTEIFLSLKDDGSNHILDVLQNEDISLLGIKMEYDAGTLNEDKNYRSYYKYAEFNFSAMEAAVNWLQTKMDECLKTIDNILLIRKKIESDLKFLHYPHILKKFEIRKDKKK